MKQKLIALILALGLIASLLTGCENAAEPSEPVESAAVETTDSQSEETAPTQPEEAETISEVTQKVIEYPIAENEILSVFAAVPPFVLSVCGDNSDIADSPALMKLSEVTGVSIDFTNYSTRNAAEEYGILLAAGDYPDLFANVVDYYNGGAEKLVNDEVVVDIAPYLEEYAPDYLNVLNNTESIKKTLTTDSGYIASFAGWAEPAAIYTGLVIRQDWMDEQGLSTPETYDELAAVLESFKANYNCKDALYLNSYASGVYSDNCLIKGYGVAGMIGSRANQHPYYQIDGTVYCGLLTPEYKEYLSMLNEWYQKGYISSDFINYNSASMDDNAIVTGSCGVFFTSNDKFQTDYSLAVDENFALSALRDVTKEKGDTLHLSQDLYAPTTIQNSWSISTQCKNVELAASFMNYFYTEEGILLGNYGTEGNSYELDENGKPQLTEKILADPDNSAFIMQYLNTTGYFLPTLVDQHRADSSMDETAIAAYGIWNENIDSAYTIINDLLPSDAEDYQNIWADICVFAQEKALQYITGEADLANFDEEFAAELKSMGIDTLTQYRQNALDAFNAK